MEAITYPITIENGDLGVSKTLASIAVTRGQLLIDTRIGERIFYPEYGSDIALFSPSVYSSEFEAEVLESALNSWCVSDDGYTYRVVSNSEIELNFNITVVI